MWRIKNIKKNDNHLILNLELSDAALYLTEIDPISFELNVGDMLTYDKYHGKKLKVLSIKDNIVEVLLPDDLNEWDKKYLKTEITLFKI